MAYNFSRTGVQIDAIHTKVDGVEDLADVTDGVNVAAAGALMASEVDANLKTFALPASVTISAFGASVVDDADAATARATLGAVALQALTDNAIPKANGVGGEVQDSGIIIDDLNNVSGAGILANIQTGTAYAPVLTDAGKLITLSNAAAITMTIPANTSVAFPVGTVLNLLQLGAGQVTVAITADTLLSKGGKVALTGQYSPATLVKTAATTWVLFGDLA